MDPKADLDTPFEMHAMVQRRAAVEVRTLAPEKVWGADLHVRGLSEQQFLAVLQRTAQELNFTFQGYLAGEGESFHYHLSRYPRRAFGPAPSSVQLDNAFTTLTANLKAAGAQVQAALEPREARNELRCVIGLAEGYDEHRKRALLEKIKEGQISDLESARMLLLELKADAEPSAARAIDDILASTASVADVTSGLEARNFALTHSVGEVEAYLGFDFRVQPAAICAAGPWGTYQEPAALVTGAADKAEAFYGLADNFRQARIALEDLLTGEARMVETRFCKDPDPEENLSGPARVRAALAAVNQIVAVGSVDGVATAAAARRLSQQSDCPVEFCQAFTVDKVDPRGWQPGRTVLLVDLAVNNRDPGMTADFVRRILAAGHTIVGVCDEHNAEDWAQIFSEVDPDTLHAQKLAIMPVSQKTGTVKSSGALLSSLLPDLDDHARELCEAADAGDRMDFSTPFGAIINQAVKSRIADDGRRIELVRHLAFNREPNEAIAGWIGEYQQILANHKEIIDARRDLGGGFVRISTVGRTVDVTTLMNELYSAGFRVVVAEGEFFDKSVGGRVKQIGFGARPGVTLDLLATLREAGINASGFAQKANVNPAEETRATSVLQAALS